MALSKNFKRDQKKRGDAASRIAEREKKRKADEEAAQKPAKDKKDRKAYDKEHRIVNRRGRQTGTKEGYDPKKGIAGSKTSTLADKKKKKKSRRRCGLVWIHNNNELRGNTHG